MEHLATPYSTPSSQQKEPEYFLKRPEAAMTKALRKFVADIDIAKSHGTAAADQPTPSKVKQYLSSESEDLLGASSSKMEQQRMTSSGSQPLPSPETPFLRFLPKWDEPTATTTTNTSSAANARHSAETLTFLADIAANLAIGQGMNMPAQNIPNGHHHHHHQAHQEDKLTQTNNDFDDEHNLPGLVPFPEDFKEQSEAELAASLKDVRKWAKKLLRARIELDESIEEGQYPVEVLIGNKEGELVMIEGKGWPSARSSFSRVANTFEGPEIQAARRLFKALKAIRFKHKKLMEDDSDFEDSETVFDNNDYLDALAFYCKKRAELVKIKAKAVKSGDLEALKVRSEPLHNNFHCAVREESTALNVLADWHEQMHPTREARALKFKLESRWLGMSEDQSTFEIFCRFWGEDYEAVPDVDESVFRGVDLPQTYGAPSRSAA